VQTWAALCTVNFLGEVDFVWDTPAFAPRLLKIYTGIFALTRSPRSFVRSKALSALTRLGDSAPGLLAEQYREVMPACVATLMSATADDEEKASAMACAAAFAIAAGPETFALDAEQLVSLIARLREHSLKSTEADTIVQQSLPTLVKLARAAPSAIRPHLAGLVGALIEDASRVVKVSVNPDGDPEADEDDGLDYLDAGDGQIGVDGEAIDIKVIALESLSELATTLKGDLASFVSQLVGIGTKEAGFAFSDEVRAAAAGLLAATLNGALRLTRTELTRQSPDRPAAHRKSSAASSITSPRRCSARPWPRRTRRSPPLSSARSARASPRSPPSSARPTSLPSPRPSRRSSVASPSARRFASRPVDRSSVTTRKTNGASARLKYLSDAAG